MRIREIRRETPDAVCIAFDVPDALKESFAYTPGQFLTLRAKLGGEEVRRCYSICAGLDDGELAVAVRHVPQGLFSHHANAALRVGDTVEVMALSSPAPVKPMMDSVAKMMHIEKIVDNTASRLLYQNAPTKGPDGKQITGWVVKVTPAVLVAESRFPSRSYWVY